MRKVLISWGGHMFVSQLFVSSIFGTHVELEIVVWLLQFNNLRIDQRKEPYIKVNTRELDRVLSTIYLPLYTNY